MSGTIRGQHGFTARVWRGTTYWACDVIGDSCSKMDRWGFPSELAALRDLEAWLVEHLPYDNRLASLLEKTRERIAATKEPQA